MERNNKKAGIVIILFVIVALAFYFKGDSNTGNLSERAKVYVDPETGVNYIFYSEGTGRSSHGGLSVRYKQDGSIYVTERVIGSEEGSD